MIIDENVASNATIPLLSEVRLANFRSFVDVTVPFGPLTILIGPNAAGKSNLLEGIVFFRNLAEHGLDDAVSMQGGIDNLRNVRLAKGTTIKLGFDITWPEVHQRPYVLQLRSKKKARSNGRYVTLPVLRYRNMRLSYDLSLGTAARQRGIRIVSERLKVDFEVAILERGANAAARAHADWYKSTLEFNVASGRLSSTFETTGSDVLSWNEFDAESDAEQYNPADVIMRQEFITFGLEALQAIAKVPRYDVDPALGKSALPVTGRAELEEDGDNLPSALRSILSDPADRDKLLALVSDALPFVKDIDIASFSDMTRFLQVRETYTSRSLIPGYLLSDGTIDVITLIVGLYFQTSFLTLFEEPDRGLHPALIRKIGGMMVEECEHRQVIATTHSTDLINSIPPDSIQCIVRGEDGASVVFKPVESPKFSAFLESMGIGDLNSTGFFANL